MHNIMDAPYIVGMWRLLQQDYIKGPEALAKYLHQRIDTGCALFDHANIYSLGAVEDAFGQALAKDKSLKHKVHTITKAGIILKDMDTSSFQVKHYNTSAQYLQGQLDGSLKRLGVEQVNLFLIHRPDPLTDYAELGEALDSLIAAGKTAAVGVSNFTVQQCKMLQAHMKAPIVANQIELSVFERSAILDGTIQDCGLHNIKVQAWSPFGGGVQFGHRAMTKLEALAEAMSVPVEALMLAWIGYLPGRPIPIVGSFNEERLQKALQWKSVPMDHPLWFTILEAFEGKPVP